MGNLEADFYLFYLKEITFLSFRIDFKYQQKIDVLIIFCIDLLMKKKDIKNLRHKFIWK